MTLTSCGAMELLWFYLLLGCLTLSDSFKSNESCLSQPVKIIWRQVQSNVDIPCVVYEECPGQPWKYEWFLFKENYHIRLKLSDGPGRYRLKGAHLHISFLQVNDSGIYHCAAVSLGPPGRGRQHVGPGTTLNVKVKIKTTLSNTYLWVVFALLSVYSLAVVTLIVKKCSCRKIHQIDKYNSTTKMQFQDVLQEMHGRKLRGASKENSSNLPQTEADDIYQNVKERFETTN